MKRQLTLLRVMVVVLCTACCSVLPADDANAPLPRTNTARLFDCGCSLIVARVIGTETRVWIGIDITVYELLPLRTLQAGDMKPHDLASPIFVMAGTNHDLEQAKSYAVFISKEIPDGFRMLFGNTIVPVNERDQAQISALTKAAASAYKASSIKAFRERPLDIEPTDLHLTQSLRATLKSFKAKPHVRTTEGRAIWESDLGSRKDESRPWSSNVTYLPPKYPLTRGQALELLGKPTLVSGFTYFWYCGPDPQPDFAVHQGPETMDYAEVPHYGVLTVRFDKTGLAKYMRYTAFDDEDITDFHSIWR